MITGKFGKNILAWTNIPKIQKILFSSKDGLALVVCLRNDIPSKSSYAVGKLHMFV